MTSKHKVLVVDDDMLVRDLLGTMLEKFGYEVLLASGGKMALEIIESISDLDCIILDWMMPDMNGLEVMEELHKRESVPPVLMLSARSGREEVLEAIQSGVSDYVTKPPHMGDLVLRLNRLIRKNEKSEVASDPGAPYLGYSARCALAVVDVSQTGLCLETTFPIPPDSVVMVSSDELSSRLDLPKEYTFAVRIANCTQAGRHYRVGGEFIGHDSDLSRRITRAALSTGSFRAKR